MAKKFYWLKIQEEFFTQKEVKALRKFKKGATYVLIYQKMLVFSLKNDNKLYFDNVMDSLEEEVALMIDEKVDDVKFTIDFLKRVNLVEFEEDEVKMLQVEELTGEESESAKRVRKFREKKKLSCNVTETNCNVDEISCNSSEISCNKNVTLEKEIEKEKELEKESEIELEKKDKIPAADDNLKKITKLYEKNIGTVYPTNAKWLMRISEKITYELFEKIMNKCLAQREFNFAYMNKILENCIDNNVSTVEKFDKDTKEFWEKQNNKTCETEQDCEEPELASAEDLEKLRIMEERLFAS